MPLLEIIRNPEPAKLVRMGHAPVVIDTAVADPKDIAAPLEDLALSLGRFNEALKAATSPPPEPVKSKQGRKKMADEKKLGHETGVQTIHEEDPGKQGPIGTGGKKPANPPSEEVEIGNKEDEDNG